ncbi:isopenicillin N synthase family dioxygenase [Hoeflea sp.]|uniref:isopenicillin N synthase family dioxygenase n=1 Tax=Hoeflea sp. TaxID=1940281 RepID=UPI003B01EBBB
MSQPAPRQEQSELIPVIDIGPLRDGSDPVTVARKLHRASREVGFIYVSNHGIPEETIESARALAMDFFRRPAEQKNRVAVSGAHRGFLSVGGAKMQDDAKADLKESFIWGYEDGNGVTPDDHSLRGDNRWPAFMPELQSVSMNYFNRVHEVAHHLMRGFALGLDLAEDTFLKTNDAPLSRASFVYYPPQENGNSGQFGVGPHTDFGVLTVLCQDSVGGLQVETLDGEWIAAPPIPGTLVVNVGDLLARWTNGEYRSTPHRVINTSGKERLSLVLAYDPEPGTMIDPRDIFGPDCAMREEPISCGDYLQWRFAKAFSYRNDNGK